MGSFHPCRSLSSRLSCPSCPLVLRPVMAEGLQMMFSSVSSSTLLKCILIHMNELSVYLSLAPPVSETHRKEDGQFVLPVQWDLIQSIGLSARLAQRRLRLAHPLLCY